MIQSKLFSFRDDFNDTLFNDSPVQGDFLLPATEHEGNCDTAILIQFDINDCHADVSPQKIALNLLYFYGGSYFSCGQVHFY
jgi:hypothetical protein